MSKKYYPNNWQEYKDAPENMFIPHTFEEFMAWKVGQWELPSSVCCIVRSMNVNTKKVKETVFSRHSDAKKHINALINEPDIEFSVADHEAVHFIYPEPPTNV